MFERVQILVISGYIVVHPSIYLRQETRVRGSLAVRYRITENIESPFKLLPNVKAGLTMFEDKLRAIAATTVGQSQSMFYCVFFLCQRDGSRICVF